MARPTGINAEWPARHRAERQRKAALTRFVTLQQISDSYGIAMSTLRQWADDNKFPTYTGNDHHVRVKVEDAERILKPRKTNGEHTNGAPRRKVKED